MAHIRSAIVAEAIEDRKASVSLNCPVTEQTCIFNRNYTLLSFLRRLSCRRNVLHGRIEYCIYYYSVLRRSK